MGTISKINGISVIDLLKISNTSLFNVTSINGLDLGVFLLARTTSTETDFDILEVITIEDGGFVTVNNDNIIKLVTFGSNGVTSPVFDNVDLSSVTGSTNIFMISTSPSSVTTISLGNNSMINFLNTSGMTNLINLTTSASSNFNNISSLDLTDNTSLMTLALGNGQFPNLNSIGGLASLTNLTTLDIRNNPMTNTSTSLLSTLTNLVNLNIDNCGFSDLILTNQTALTTLTARNCRMTSLDLSNNTNITSINLLLCQNLTTLNTTGLTSVSTFIGSLTPITTLDVSLMTSLTNCTFRGCLSLTGTITLNSNVLSTCDFTSTNVTLTGYNVASLTRVEFNGTNNPNIDVSNATGLTRLDANDSNLVSITLPTNNQNTITRFSFSENPNLNVSTFNLTGLTNCSFFDFRSGTFTQSEIDQFFIDINNNTTVVGTINAESQVGSSVSSASLTARNNLISNGWTITI